MTTLYCARWILPLSSPEIVDGAVAVDGQKIASVGNRKTLVAQFPEAATRELGESVIIPGLIKSHSHLEITAMRGFLEHQAADFFAWRRILSHDRLDRVTADDLE